MAVAPLAVVDSSDSSIRHEAPSPKTIPDLSLSKGRIFSEVAACSESKPTKTSSQIGSYPPHATHARSPDRTNSNPWPIAFDPEEQAFANIGVGVRIPFALNASNTGFCGM